MKNAKLTIAYDSEKLSAIQQFAGADLQQLLQEQLDKIYAKAVPKAVQQYIDGKTGARKNKHENQKQG